MRVTIELHDALRRFLPGGRLAAPADRLREGSRLIVFSPIAEG